MSDRKAWNSTLRPVAKSKRGKQKTPRARKGTSALERMLGEGKIKRASKLNYRQPGKEGWWRWAKTELWPWRDHKCVVCGCPLGPEPLPIYFSHLLERSTYPDYMRDARNVVIKCAGHHWQWHNIPKAELLSGAKGHQQEWLLLFRLEESLKHEAHHKR